MKIFTDLHDIEWEFLESKGLAGIAEGDGGCGKPTSTLKQATIEIKAHSPHASYIVSDLVAGKDSGRIYPRNWDCNRLTPFDGCSANSQ